MNPTALKSQPQPTLDPIDARAARDLMLDAYAALVQCVRQAAAERGEPVPAEARLLAEEAMRRLLGPAFEKPTRADLVVVKKRLDACVNFDAAPPELRAHIDTVCLGAVEPRR